MSSTKDAPKPAENNTTDALAVLAAGMSGGKVATEMFKKIMSVIDTLSLSDLSFKTISACCGNIGAIMVLQYYLAGSDRFYKHAKGLGWAAATTVSVYRSHRIMGTKDTTRYDHHLINAILERGDTDLTNTISAYWVKENDDSVVVYSIPFIHDSWWREIHESAKKKYIVENSKITQVHTLEFGLPNRLLWKPRIVAKPDVFPSVNCERLYDILEKTLTAVKHTRLFSITPILIDGFPGLGKSSAAEFLAKMNLFPRMLYIDMMNHTERKMSEIMSTTTTALTDVNKDTILFIDELDKWVELSINRSWQEDKRKANGSTSSTQTAVQPPRPGTTAAPTGPTREGVIAFNQSGAEYDAYSRAAREDVMTRLFQLLAPRHIGASVVIVFCSNNFNSIMNGLEMTHHEATINRIQRYTFQYCDKEDLIRFFRWSNEKFHNDVNTVVDNNSAKTTTVVVDIVENEELPKFDATLFINDDDFAHLTSLIRDNLCVTYREVSQMQTLSSFNFFETVRRLNEISDNRYAAEAAVVAAAEAAAAEAYAAEVAAAASATATAAASASTDAPADLTDLGSYDNF